MSCARDCLKRRLPGLGVVALAVAVLVVLAVVSGGVSLAVALTSGGIAFGAAVIAAIKLCTTECRGARAT